MLSVIGFILLFVYISSLTKRISILETKLSSQRSVSDPVTLPPPAVTPVTSLGASVPAQRVIPTPPRKPVTDTAVGLHVDITQISGVRWLTIIGVLALLFGLGFFLKYAIDQNWITPVMRVLLGVGVGGLLMFLGELWRERYSSYAVTLVGGGLAIVYFSFFAAFSFYHLISQPVALALLVVMSAVGALLSFRYSSKTLCVIAMFGGYLAPLMVGSGENKQIALFVYVTFLNLTVLALLLRKFWVELLYVLLIGTAMDFGLWADRFSADSNALVSAAFLFINFMIVTLLVSLLFKTHQHGEEKVEVGQYIGIFHAFLAFLFFGATTSLLYEYSTEYLAFTHVLAGLVVFLAYAFIDRIEDKRINYILSLIGTVFISFGVWWYLVGPTRIFALLCLGLIGVVVGKFLQRREIRFWSVCLVLVAGFLSLGEPFGDKDAFFANSRFLIQMLAALSLLISGYVISRGNEDGEERGVAQVCKVLASGLIWFSVSSEIVMNFKGLDSANFKNLLLSIWWVCYAVLLGAISAMKHNAILRKASVALFVLAILKVFTYDVLALELGYRIVSFVVLGVMLLLTAFYYQKHSEKIKALWEGSK